jgi:hypothetical protein
MADSYTEAFLLFSSDEQLREDYLTYAGTTRWIDTRVDVVTLLLAGTIRVGKLLEDLDALSGTIACKYTVWAVNNVD